MKGYERPELENQQHGFMPSSFCVTVLGTMLRVAWKNISADAQADVIYTDYTLALQSVNHKIWVNQSSKSYNIPGKVLGWLKSYMAV